MLKEKKKKKKKRKQNKTKQKREKKRERENALRECAELYRRDLSRYAESVNMSTLKRSPNVRGQVSPLLEG